MTQVNIVEFESFIESMLLGQANEGLFDKFKNQIDFITDLASKLNVGFKDLLKLFKEKLVLKFFNSIKWSFNILFKAVKEGYRAYKTLLNEIFKFASKNKVTKWTTEKLKELDTWLQANPKMKRLGGFAVGGILVFIWLNMSFTGDIEYDFDFSDIIGALLGDFSLENIFGGDKGLKMLSLLASGVFVGLSFPWVGGTVIHLAFSTIKALNDRFKIISVSSIKKSIFREALVRTTLIENFYSDEDIELLKNSGLYDEFTSKIKNIEIGEVIYGIKKWETDKIRKNEKNSVYYFVFRNRWVPR